MFKVPDRDPKSRSNRFFFKVPRQRFRRSTYSLPLLRYVPLDVMAEARKVEGPLQLQRVVELLGDKRLVKAIGGLNQPEVAELSAAWMEASGIDLGELIASSR